MYFGACQYLPPPSLSPRPLALLLQTIFLSFTIPIPQLSSYGMNACDCAARGTVEEGIFCAAEWPGASHLYV